MSDIPSPAPPEEDHERLELIREGITMALYIGLSLLAVLVALPTTAAEENAGLALLVLFTAIGLVLAHQVALRLSTRLVRHGRIESDTTRAVVVQWIGGGAVAVVAALPLLILGSGGLPVSRFLLLAFVAVVGYLAARAGEASRLRAVAYMGGVVVVVLGVLAVKGLVGH